MKGLYHDVFYECYQEQHTTPYLKEKMQTKKIEVI